MISMGASRRSPLLGVCWDAMGSRCARDAWGWLGRQIELELFDQEFLVGVQFRVAAHDQGSLIGRREMDIEHLHGRQFVEHGSRREAGRQRLEPSAERDVQAIGEEGDEDVRFDALFALMVDRAQIQIVLHVLEGGFDFDELNIELPDLGGVLSA